MTSADTRSKPNSKPWKPEVTPPRRGGNFRGKGGRQNDAGRQASNSSGTNGNSSNGKNFNGRNQSRNSSSNNRPFGNRGQNNGNFGRNQRNRGRGRFDTSPNVGRLRVASKMIRIKVDASTVINSDTSLGNALRRLRMKSPEGSAEWILITTRMASIQIMMILASILMTMMMRYLPLYRRYRSWGKAPPQLLQKVYQDSFQIKINYA